MEMDKGGKDATEFLKCTGWYGHMQIPGNHNAESPNQNLLQKDRSFYEVEGGWFLLGFCCLSRSGGHIFIFSSLFLLTTGTKKWLSRQRFLYNQLLPGGGAFRQMPNIIHNSFVGADNIICLSNCCILSPELKKNTSDKTVACPVSSYWVLQTVINKLILKALK